MTITWMTFAIRLLVGFFLAIGIGIERQWLKTRAVLKTNVLVTLGSAMFVMLSIMTPGDASPTRISAQIVSGVGFLGGGVILRQGASIKGINTAATLWCAAAIGTLVGSGFLVQAYISTLAVVGANLLHRPLVEAFKQREDQEMLVGDRHLGSDIIDGEIDTNRQSKSMISQFPQYSCHLVCDSQAEVEVLESITIFAKEKDLTITMLEINNNIFSSEHSEVKEADITVNLANQSDSVQLIGSEQIILSLKTKTDIKSISWELVAG